jgi:signal transduction histidine kinase
MNVIRGNAELIADGAGIDPSTGAEQIRRTADDLVELGERAREVERMMALGEPPDPEADVASVVDAVVDAVGERYPEVAVTTAVPAESTLPLDDRVLRVVLENVVENACEHNDANEPIVVVSADRSDGRYRIAVSDNGPGIPEMERSVIDAGTEDPLEHSTGLGLWAIQWGVTRLGGDLSFTDNDPRGTVVRIDLPTARASGPE